MDIKGEITGNRDANVAFNHVKYIKMKFFEK